MPGVILIASVPPLPCPPICSLSGMENLTRISESQVNQFHEALSSKIKTGGLEILATFAILCLAAQSSKVYV